MIEKISLTVYNPAAEDVRRLTELYATTLSRVPNVAARPIDHHVDVEERSTSILDGGPSIHNVTVGMVIEKEPF